MAIDKLKFRKFLNSGMAPQTALLFAESTGQGFIPTPPTPPDGYALVWNATSGTWVGADRTASGQELAYAENQTGTATSLSTAANTFSAIVDIPNVSISVPPTTKAIWLEGNFVGTQTVVGAGMLQSFLTETTSGSTIRSVRGGLLPNVADQHDNTVPVVVNRVRLPSSASTRTFKLQARLGVMPGSNQPTVVVANAAAAVSYLAAFSA